MKSVLFEDVCSQYFGVVNILRAKQIKVNLPPKEGKVSIKGKDKKLKKEWTRIAVFAFLSWKVSQSTKWGTCWIITNVRGFYIIHTKEEEKNSTFLNFQLMFFFLHLLWIVNSINFDLYSSFCWNHLISSSFLHCFIYREPLAFLWRCDFPAPQVCSDWS